MFIWRHYRDHCIEGDLLVKGVITNYVVIEVRYVSARCA
jgi:hypothetical protein